MLGINSLDLCKEAQAASVSLFFKGEGQTTV